MNERRIVKKRRNLPHWTVDGSVYSVTFRVAKGSLNHAERAIVLEHVRNGERQVIENAELDPELSGMPWLARKLLLLRSAPVTDAGLCMW